jgi:hypothetical protein
MKYVEQLWRKIFLTLFQVKVMIAHRFLKIQSCNNTMKVSRDGEYTRALLGRDCNYGLPVMVG